MMVSRELSRKRKKEKERGGEREREVFVLKESERASERVRFCAVLFGDMLN